MGPQDATVLDVARMHPWLALLIILLLLDVDLGAAVCAVLLLALCAG